MLYSFLESYPQASLNAYDISPKMSAGFKQIKNFEAFFSGEDLADSKLKGSFDFISMIMSLEHLFDLDSTLSTLYNLLDSKGILTISVPDVESNLWDIFTYDHTQHFSKSSLARLLEKHSFTPILPKEQIDREIIMLGFKDSSCAGGAFCHVELPCHVERSETSSGLDSTTFSISHLQNLLNSLKTLTQEFNSCKVFGVTGSSIMLCQVLESYQKGFVECFVDEDNRKVGKIQMDKQILHPDSCYVKLDSCHVEHCETSKHCKTSSNSPILVPLGKKVLDKLRFKYPHLTFIPCY